MASDNKTLGRFQLGDIPLAPRGVPQIEVTFDIDANGIVNVSAKDLGTGKSQKITIQSGSGLSEEEIKRMVREAEENAESDKKRKEEADLKNEAEQIIFGVKKSVQDLGSEVTETEKNDIDEKIAELEKALKDNDIEQIKVKKDELAKASQNVAMRAYQKAQKANEANQNNNDKTKKEDDVVDAEFEDVK
jgi:molecular chaperone DnaK